MPELRTQAERDEVLRRFRVSALALCNRCDRPIQGLVYVDPKGGYYPKPEGTPDFLAKKPKATYDRECFDLVRGGKPKPKPQPPPQQQTPKAAAPVAVAGTSKLKRKLAQKILDTMRADRKKKWSVWDLVCALKSIAQQADVRGACHYLKQVGLMQRRQGGLWVDPHKPLP